MGLCGSVGSILIIWFAWVICLLINLSSVIVNFMVGNWIWVIVSTIITVYLLVTGPSFTKKKVF